MNIKNNLDDIQKKIAKACQKSKRDPSSVHLLAVSKKQPIEKIIEAYDLGIRDFGENYIQELVLKKESLSHLADIRWHLIGHLQSNKAKIAAESCTFFHALDSEKVLKELAKTAKNLGLFIQVNLENEATKSGILPDQVKALAQAILDLKGSSVYLKGLMAIPIPQETPEQMRPAFQKLKHLAQNIDSTLELSMGMSEDFEVAIEEGSNWIRVGRRLFGERA